MEIGLLRDLGPLGIHHDQARALALGPVDHGGEVEIRPGDVVAPRDDQSRVLDLLGADARGGAIGADPGLGADASAKRLAIEEGGTHPMEEAQVHGAGGEEAMRPGVVQRQHASGTVGRDGAAHVVMDQVEGFIPGGTGEASLALGPHATKRRGQPARAVDEVWVESLDLGADDARGIGIRARAADLDDAVALDGDGEAAGVGAVERTDAVMVDTHREASSWRTGSRFTRLASTLVEPHAPHNVQASPRRVSQCSRESGAYPMRSRST